MIHIISRNQRKCATEDTKYFASKVLDFGNLCSWYIFCDSVQIKYVGTASYDSQKMLADIYLSLSNLKMVYDHRRCTLLLTSDDCLVVIPNIFLSFHQTL